MSSACGNQMMKQQEEEVEVEKDVKVERRRPAANFPPCIWGDYFLNFTPDDHETRERKEREVAEVKQQVREELIVMLAHAAEKPVELLCFIDNIQRLGVSYHFVDEIEEGVQAIFKSYSSSKGLKEYNGEDLHLTSLCFRILRQHGFHASTDVFESFRDDQHGGFKASLVSDVQAMLSFYEASHVRVHGETILDEALEFTSAYLKSLDASELEPPLASLVARSLNIPNHKAMERLECRHYITIYGQNPTHNKTLLKFAKLDFNLLQSLYKAELKDLSKWWKDLDTSTRLPFAIRDRVVEGYFWTMAALYEPQYSLGRKIFLQMLKLLSIHDDLFDAHGTIQELESFYQAIQRWDMACMDELPVYLKPIYQTTLDCYKEFERDLAKERRSHLVQYVIKVLKDMDRTYLQEARWRHEKYTPTYEEYMTEAAIFSFGNNLAMVTILMGLGEIATEDMFKWVCENPYVLVCAGKLGRLMNDMVSCQFEHERDHVQSAVGCYMRQYGVSKEQTHKEFNIQLENIWKDTNEAMLRPTVIPRALLLRQLYFNRVVHLIYKDDDAYTFPEKTSMKDNILSVFINPIPI